MSLVSRPRCCSAFALATVLLFGGGPAANGQPYVGLGGDATQRPWISGAPEIIISAGVLNYPPGALLRVDAALDGRPFETQSWPNGIPGVFVRSTLPSAWVADGVHTITATSADNQGATASTAASVKVDNNAPTSPLDVAVDGGVGWRASAALRASWTNPVQQFAPVAAVRYRLCPSQGGPQREPLPSCVYREIVGPDLKTLPSDVVLPSEGLWTARIWLVDAAANADEATAATFDVGYDPTPPQVAGFVAQDPNDPARVTVAASDDVAPVVGGSIEVRRRGAKTWRPLDTIVINGGLSAFVDDETLRRGRYTLRATVTNAAGLQQGTERGADGAVKSLTLPIRTGSRLQAGRRVGKICHRQGKRRRCRFRLAQRVAVELGRPITLRARLQSAGRPVANQSLEIWERASVVGSKWAQIGTVQTDAAGRVRYKAPPGVARKLRFRYPGTPHVRGDNATIALNVQAKSTIDVSRRNVINGEYVTFRGRLKSRPVPVEGALVELQVRSRGKWRTFAQPRANAAGAWRYRYRFETVSRGARYRFRARVRRQAGYPYATGSSRPIGVRVFGL